MTDRSSVNRWAAAVFALLFAVIVGIAVGTWAYDLGLSHGLAEHLRRPSRPPCSIRGTTTGPGDSGRSSR